MSRRVKVVLGQRQAEALVAVASRGLDEWQFELDDLEVCGVTGLMGPRSEHTLALAAFRKVILAVEAAR